MAKVEVRHVSKIFGDRPEIAFKMMKDGADKETIFRETGMTVGVYDAHFTIEEGEIFVIMGLSGSGKSTLLRLINRLIEPTFGEVYIDGRDIVKMKPRELREVRRKKLGMVFQHFALFPRRTVLDNVAYGLEIRGVPKKEREEQALEAIRMVGLDGYESSYPEELSGGMQQRVGLARALAGNVDILLMDEAFSALDPLIRGEMQDELLNLQAQMKKTIIFITHDLDEALKLGDRIAIMKDGRIVQIGTPQTIVSQPADAYVAQFVEKVDRSKVLLASDVMKRPDIVAQWKDGPRMAIRKMEEAGISSIFVVDRGHLKGLMTIERAIEAVKRGAFQEEDLEQDFPRTSPETPLTELMEIAAETRYPIAVVEGEKLLGIIVRVLILSALLGQQGEVAPSDRSRHDHEGAGGMSAEPSAALDAVDGGASEGGAPHALR